MAMGENGMSQKWSQTILLTIDRITKAEFIDRGQKTLFATNRVNAAFTAKEEKTIFETCTHSMFNNRA